MSGRLPSRIAAYDNAAEFPADVPTFAHALRNGGYRTILSGKMHFCGADQLHGFEERLTTDIYPSDFNWTPDWERPHDRKEWYHNMSSVLDAGPCVRTNQLDYDDEVVFAAERKLYEIVRDRDRAAVLHGRLDDPSARSLRDPRGILEPLRGRRDRPSPAQPGAATRPTRIRGASVPCARPTRRRRARAQIRAARRAYYGAISYVDDQFGRLRQALRATGLADDTIIVIVSDHGEMLGERGLWYKMTFFEGSRPHPARRACARAASRPRGSRRRSRRWTSCRPSST